MPVETLWGLIVPLILLAIGLAIKNADLRHTLKRTEEELSSARSEIKSLNEKHDKEISGIKEFQVREIEKLSNELSHLKNPPKKEDDWAPFPW